MRAGRAWQWQREQIRTERGEDGHAMAGVVALEPVQCLVVPVHYGCEHDSVGLGQNNDLSALLLDSVDFYRRVTISCWCKIRIYTLFTYSVTVN